MEVQKHLKKLLENMKVLTRIYIYFTVLSFTLTYFFLKLIYGHEKMIEFFSDRLNHLGREYLSSIKVDKTYENLKLDLEVLSIIYLRNFVFLKKDSILIQKRFFDLIDRKIRWQAID